MKKIFLIARYELITMLTRRSFLLVAFGLPVIASLIFFGISLLQRSAPDVLADIISGLMTEQVEGYVDQAGVIKFLPEDVAPDALIAFRDEAEARQALESGDIVAFYIIPEDFLDTGAGEYIRPGLDLFSANSPADVMQWVLRVNLLDGDEELAARVARPLNLDKISLSPEPQRDENNPLTEFVPYAITFIFYIVLVGAATLLLNSVASEKENRVIEVLMMSVTPHQLLSGKILGLGLTGLIQTILWMGTGYVLLGLSGRTFNLPAVDLPPSILLWGLLFFLLGYAIYGSLMAGVGALVPNMRETSQASLVVLLPLFVPLFLNSVVTEDPHGSLATAISLFPLTAPITMMTRLASGGVPIWQPLLAAALMFITAILILRAVAGLFQAQTILSGQSFKLRRFFGALFGRV